MAAKMLPAMLKRNRERAGLPEHRAAARIHVSLRTYRQIEAGEEYPTSDAWDAICRAFGWPQTFTSLRGEVVRR